MVIWGRVMNAKVDMICTLKIPQTLRVRTEVRLIRKNSDIIIRNAKTPPKSMTNIYGRVSFCLDEPSVVGNPPYRMQALFKREEECALKDVEIAFNKSGYDYQDDTLGGSKVKYRCTRVT
jgi:hypothetical protein